jgi:hypothetical protein
MTSIPLAPYQKHLIERPVETRLFLEGPAGSGKTTAGVARMIALLRAGVPASEMLLLAPQRTLGAPYQEALRAYAFAGSQADVLTVGGLARRMVDLFWPLAAKEAGFARPDRPPAFLTLESALYYMAYLVRPLLQRGLFDSVAIDRNRIFSQIIDNLNKAAIVGFPFTEIGERLKAGAPIDTAQTHIYEDAQGCATLFREYCLQNNLLDFSLQMEIFRERLWPHPVCREYLTSNYRHIIFENVEEDTPAAHDIIGEWLKLDRLESALLVYDCDAGYRRFLGASPTTGYDLHRLCDEQHVFAESLVSPAVLHSLCGQIGQALERPNLGEAMTLQVEQVDAVLQFPKERPRFYPQMLDWVVDSIRELVDSGAPPGEIVVLAPLLPDSLRFSLMDRLQTLGIPVRSHRPSRSLREEPAAQALLTLAKVGHPHWGMRISRFELAYALIQTVQDLDFVRAQLLVEAVQRGTGGSLGLLPFERIRAAAQQRITYYVGNRYEAMRRWLEAYTADPVEEIDYFFSRLFGEVLSQPGFAFHRNWEAGRVCANLIESAQKFRWAVEGRAPLPADPEREEEPLGKEYINMIQDGILAAQYIQSWEIPAENAVLVAPAYTFLLANRPVAHQFWLDIGSSAWAERLSQPLTHPYILSRAWQPGRVWTDADEIERGRESLYSLVLGLARRCRGRIYMGLCDLNEGGYESRGLLLRALEISQYRWREAAAGGEA